MHQQTNRRKEGLTVQRRVPAFLCVIARCWLWFDLSTTLAVRPVILDGWRFCLPFFIVCVNSGDWTFITDLAIALILGGAVLGMVDEWPNLPIRQSRARKDQLLAIILAVTLTLLLIILLVVLNPLGSLGTKNHMMQKNMSILGGIETEP